MYEQYSEETKNIINRCHNLAVAQNEYMIGTEHLLLALFYEENSSCNILLKEYGVDLEQLMETIESIVLFRKSISGLVIYTPQLKQIFEDAIRIKEITRSHLVYEEHLFYTLLCARETIAHVVLEKLNIDSEDLKEEILDVMEWEIESPKPEKKESLLDKFPFVVNLTQSIKEKPLPPLVLRDEILERMNNVMNKKFKRNVLLIGNAGVGKTAIVEGLASTYVKEKRSKQIISLNINSLVSGTKYRGDFEKRIELFMEEIKGNDDYILFIDEIHNVINQSNLDGGVDLANIIKPALSRNDICCIGATTLSEYHKYIAKDSAFSRRFVKIFVDEPSLEDTITILQNIKPFYEEYHGVQAPDNIIEYICQVSDKLITNNYFPDKAIDLLDESCALSKSNGEKKLKKEHINHLINQINNNKFNETIKKKIELYPYLIKNFLRYYNANKFDYKPITSILCENMDENHLLQLIDDLQVIFNIKPEATKIIDLNNYTESHSISNLLGAPPGYVGYDNDNTLTKFINKYQKSIVIFKNIDEPLIPIKNMIEQILQIGFIEDLSSNKVYFSNTIVIGTSTANVKSIGYLNDDIKSTKQTKDIPFVFEHKLHEVPHISEAKETPIDYATIFTNYLNHLKQWNHSIDLNELYEIDPLRITEQAIDSFENIMSEIWLQEQEGKSFKILFNELTNDFKICSKS